MQQLHRLGRVKKQRFVVGGARIGFLRWRGGGLSAAGWVCGLWRGGRTPWRRIGFRRVGGAVRGTRYEVRAPIDGDGAGLARQRANRCGKRENWASVAERDPRSPLEPVGCRVKDVHVPFVFPGLRLSVCHGHGMREQAHTHPTRRTPCHAATAASRKSRPTARSPAPDPVR
jgi:hypothetical protein